MDSPVYLDVWGLNSSLKDKNYTQICLLRWKFVKNQPHFLNKLKTEEWFTFLMTTLHIFKSDFLCFLTVRPTKPREPNPNEQIVVIFFI